MYPGRMPPAQKELVPVGNALHWRHVDEFTILQAACLWSGIEPLNGFENISISPEAVAAYQMLTQAIEDGRLAAYHPSPAPRVIKVAQQGQHAPHMLLLREDLKELAGFVEDKPAFLFPNTIDTSRTRARSRAYSSAKLRKWYRERVANWPASETPPSRDDDSRAAKIDGFLGVPRDALRALRHEYAPPDWSKKGPRPRNE